MRHQKNEEEGKKLLAWPHWTLNIIPGKKIVPKQHVIFVSNGNPRLHPSIIHYYVMVMVWTMVEYTRHRIQVRNQYVPSNMSWRSSSKPNRIRPIGTVEHISYSVFDWNRFPLALGKMLQLLTVIVWLDDIIETVKSANERLDECTCLWSHDIANRDDQNQ